MSYLSDGGAFLVDAIFGLFIFCVLIRFWMHWTHADFRNPIGQFLVQLTNPLLIPFRQVITTNRSFAFATLGIAIVLTAIKFFILFAMSKQTPAITGLIMLAIADILKSSVFIFLGALLIRVISSWIAPQGSYNPFLSVIYSLTEPLMAPARRLIPSMGGMDLSPILILIFLQLSLIIIVAPISDLARSLL